MNYLLLVIGFVLLVKGADFFVSGSSNIAKKFGIPEVVIGLTIVAFGTSAPELAVSATASLSGSNAIAVSNVLGSNLFNLLLVLGTCSFIKTINVSDRIINHEFPVLIVGSVLLVVLMYFGHELTRLDGVILLALFAYFIASTLKFAFSNKEAIDTGLDGIKEQNIFLSIIFIVGGLIAIVEGGNLVVDSATAIATSFGVSETVIGLTIVAMGTSLPELVTSIVAAKKGNSDIAIGNVVGSNIFNILLILGVTSVISPITIDNLGLMDGIIALAVTILVYLIAKRYKKIDRKSSIILLILFVVYNVFIFFR